MLPKTLPSPFPQYNTNSTELCVVIPIFKHEVLEFEIKHLINALWTKLSFLRNTDAIELGIPVKFYIEDQLLSEYASYLFSQGVHVSDCIPFENNSVYNSEIHTKRSNLALCLKPLSDDRLSDYKHLLVVDCHMYLVSKSKESISLLSLTEYIDDNQIGCRIGGKITLYDVGNQYTNWLSSYQTPDDLTDAIRQVCGFYEDVDTILGEHGSCSNPYTLFPQTFHDHYPDFRDYCEFAIPILRDDEAVLGIYIKYNRQSVKAIASDLPVIVTMSEYDDVEKDVFFFHKCLEDREIYEKYHL